MEATAPAWHAVCAKVSNTPFIIRMLCLSVLEQGGIGMQQLAKRAMGLMTFFTLVLLYSTSSMAIPLSLTFTIDEKTKGKAVLKGDLLLAPWQLNSVIEGLDSLSMTARGNDGSPDWEATVVFRRFRYDDDPWRYTINQIRGRHISDPPPHKGEDSPGPPLLLRPAGELYDNLSTQPAANQPGNLVKATRNQHDLPDHFDVMTATLLDLNGANTAGVLALDEIRLTIDFNHTPTPEPSAMILFGTGLMGLIGYGWQRQRQNT
jgi:hypothetical protein